MTLSISGLASGIDVDSLVSSLTSVAQQPLTALQTKKTQVDSAQSTVTTISSRLSMLKATALTLSTSTGFASFAANSSDSAVVASVSGAANAGSYSVNVTQLAQAQKSRSASFASATAAIGSAFTLAVTDAAGAKSISVSATDTLGDIATKISSSGARVAASVINDGSGYRLVVQGLDTGAANGFTVSGGPPSLAMTDYQSAQDANLTVDGLAVTSASNQVSSVIPGVKLALTKVTSSPATIQVSTDPSALETKLASFVSAFNSFITAAHGATGFGSTTASSSVLASDSAIRGAVHKVSSIIGNVVPGTTGKYTTLGSVGIKSNADGTIAIDNTKLEAALSADPSSVARLFVTDGTTGATGMMQTMMDAVDSLVKTATSPITARATALGAQSKQLADSATRMQTRIDAYTAQLKKKFSDMDTAVAKYQSMLKQVPST